MTLADTKILLESNTLIEKSQKSITEMSGFVIQAWDTENIASWSQLIASCSI